MLDIRKTKNANGYDSFIIETEQGKFVITFENNLDLYWSYFPSTNFLESDSTKEFVLTKENYFVYQVFDELFEAIKCKTPYINSVYNDKSSKKKLKFTYDTNINNLFQNNQIEWHSDDYDYDEASVLTIRKNEDETFSVIFEKSKNNLFFKTFNVRFRNSGSRYNPYNITFMNMYHKLREHDFDYHQIHMEEYLCNQKIKKLQRNADNQDNRYIK